MFRGLMHTGERKTMFDFIQVTPSPRIAEDYATGVAFDDIVERPAPGTDEFDEAEEAMDDRRPQIQAFYVKAENPWDFRDRRHRERLAEALDLDPEEFESGAPEAIEDETVTAAIRELGFDSFYTWDEVEGGQAADVALAVFEQSQLKSATGNRGTFDPENPDIRYSTGINAQAQAILKKHGLAAPVNVTASFLDEAPYCPTGRPTASRGHAGRAGPIVPGSTAGGWCC